jgi:hypothetical protein
MARPRVKVSARAENAILSRLKATIDKYGFTQTRLVAMRLFKNEVDKRRLEGIIKAKERELEQLKRTGKK